MIFDPLDVGLQRRAIAARGRGETHGVSDRRAWSERLSRKEF
jgi:hypothetical protein